MLVHFLRKCNHQHASSFKLGRISLKITCPRSYNHSRKCREKTPHSRFSEISTLFTYTAWFVERKRDKECEINRYKLSVKSRQNELHRLVGDYMDWRFILPASNIGELLFYTAKYNTGPLRAWVLPTGDESQLVHIVNPLFWTIHEVDFMTCKRYFTGRKPTSLWNKVEQAPFGRVTP